MLTGRRHDLGALLARLCGEIDDWYATWVEGGAAAARARLVAAGLAIAGAGAAGAARSRTAGTTRRGGRMR